MSLEFFILVSSGVIFIIGSTDEWWEGVRQLLIHSVRLEKTHVHLH